jgi:hypothetical protein
MFCVGLGLMCERPRLFDVYMHFIHLIIMSYMVFRGALPLCTQVEGDWVDLMVIFTLLYWMEASYISTLSIDVIFHTYYGLL